MFKHFLLVGLLFLCVSCNKFENSLFGGATNTARNLNSYFSLPAFSLSSNQSVRFAIVADSHQDYGDLEKVVEIINQKPIQFVIHLGDFTHFGMPDEYEIFNHIFGRLRYPFFVLPGNHDLKTFSDKIYSKVFGNSDVYFDSSFGRLVFLNDCALCIRPRLVNFDYLTQAIATADKTKPVFLFHHHEPLNSQNLIDSEKVAYRDAIAAHPQVFIFHGHMHTPDQSSFSATGYAFQIDRTKDVSWAEVEVSDTTLKVYYCKQGSCTKVYENTVI